MKVPKALFDQLQAISAQPDDYSLLVDGPGGDRIQVSFNVCGNSCRESSTLIFYDLKSPHRYESPPDLILPPELAALTLDKLHSLKERGTRLDELVAELRANYLETQRQKIDGIGLERLKFELDVVEKMGAETLIRSNPQDGNPIVIVEIPIKVARPPSPNGTPRNGVEEAAFRLRITYFVNSSRDALARAERLLLPAKRSGTTLPSMPQFSRPLPPFNANTMLMDYVPDIAEFIQYELFPPADLLERRQALLQQLAVVFQRQLLEMSNLSQTIAILVEVILSPQGLQQPPAPVRSATGGSPNPAAGPLPPNNNSQQQQLGSVSAICRVDVSNASKEVPPIVTLISPTRSAPGRPGVAASREITQSLRWDWKLSVEDEVLFFRDQLIRLLPTAVQGL